MIHSETIPADKPHHATTTRDTLRAWSLRSLHKSRHAQGRLTTDARAKNEMKTGKHNIFIRLLIPRYDELALYLMSSSFVLLFLTHAKLRAGIHYLLFDDFELDGLIAFGFFVVGMIFSLYHAFTTREKADWEKTAMLFFAVVVNSAGGIAAGVHMLKETRGLLMVFPLWNIVNGILLLLMYRSEIVDDSCIVDDNATPLQVVVGTIVVLTSVLVCTFVFDMYWATTFSVCIAYSCNVNGVVQSIVSGTRREQG